jgi:tungstate transport system substrate-binding protein
MQRRKTMKQKKTKLIIASTTSTQNSGLFDILIPAYEQSSLYDVAVEVIAVGTGKALRMAKKGEADMLFVHDPFREKKFLAEGHGVNRRLVMHNDFVILGPENDPAKIKGGKNAIDAFELIAEKETAFVSRADDSGTNVKELDIWDDAGVMPKGQRWYIEAGAKMGDTLLFANLKQAYVLSDRGTFLNYHSQVQLKIMVESDPLLKNQYSVMAVNPAKFPAVGYREAMDFIAYVTSPAGQKIIAAYTRQGAQLFYPDAIPVVAK